MTERLYLFDTTLRDGQQTSGVDFSLDDKIRIANALDSLGLDYIEGGYPGANPTDSQFFAEDRKLNRAVMTAFGMTKRAGRSADNDPGFMEVLNAQAGAVCLVAKSWDYHVDVALGISNEENLVSIRDSVAAIAQHGREAMIDCEHFFDGYKANRDYALACATAALEAGARWVVLCDTNGGTLPDEVFEIVSDVARHIPGDRLGIHTHNDTENAVANTLAAVQAGVRQLQGTINGLGERCGNANLVSLIPTLLLKPRYAENFETGIDVENLPALRGVSNLLDELLNKTPDRHAPYVGASAFAHKGGIHVSAVMKDPSTYEHVAPELVGNQRTILVSDQAGKSNVVDRLTSAGIAFDAADPAIEHILREVKQKESEGYSYDGVGASFELLALRHLGQLPEFFDVEAYEVNVSNDPARGTRSVAKLALVIDGETVETQGAGNGPINALDMALRADLRRYAVFIDEMRLVDFKVRILNSGTEAVTRVTIESMDDAGRSWRTIGVNANIVVASLEALLDAVNYKLLRDGASAEPETGAS
ncbi:MAG: citramalate synthase [Rhizobiales bacterium TMED83]|nr:citramalate synthase [Rhodobiaceae bacterium]RPF94661.1 MAG: citramalate synthase [Rhizobiales bacterium TMED83]HCD16419.1 citramalate synthase [Rhodobiaceae bacterium]